MSKSYERILANVLNVATALGNFNKCCGSSFVPATLDWLLVGCR